MLQARRAEKKPFHLNAVRARSKRGGNKLPGKVAPPKEKEAAATRENAGEPPDTASEENECCAEGKNTSTPVLHLGSF